MTAVFNNIAFASHVKVNDTYSKKLLDLFKQFTVPVMAPDALWSSNTSLIILKTTVKWVQLAISKRVQKIEPVSGDWWILV